MTTISRIKRKERKEITKVLNGVETVVNTIIEFLNRTNDVVYACVDQTRPILPLETLGLKNAFLYAKKRVYANYTTYCDPERLQQVLSNLLRNAIEFVPADGRGRITTRVEKQRQKQDRGDKEGNKNTHEITFTIEDNGIAVTKDEVRRLFQKFYLIDTKNAFTKRQKATTLGLSVSRGIIEAHGGRIWIDENYKGGASFKFTLPIAK